MDYKINFELKFRYINGKFPGFNELVNGKLLIVFISPF